MPIKASPAKSASKGNRKARRRLRTTAPEKSAIAPTGVKFHGCGAMRTAAATAMMASASNVRNRNCFFPLAMSCIRASLRFGQKITENKAVARHDFTRAHRDRRAEDGTIKYERMKLAIFSARVGVRRKFPEKGMVELASGKLRAELCGINANGNGAKSFREKVRTQFPRIALPNGEDRGHANAGKIALAIFAEVLEENVPESHFADALIIKASQRRFHARFVDRIHALRGNQNFMKGQADRFGLPTNQRSADAVHADAVVALGDRRKERGHAEFPPAAQNVQRHGAVLAAAPAEEDGFLGRHDGTLSEVRVSPAGARFVPRPGRSIVSLARCGPPVWKFHRAPN